MSVSFDDIAAAHERIRAHAKRTPVLSSAIFDTTSGAQVRFKCENLQRMGAFKFRGAFNALAQLDSPARKRGVVAYSSGNHAQAVALAGRTLGIPVTILMPVSASPVKLAATRGYGAEVITYDPARESREQMAAELAGRRGLAVIPPFDHPHVIAGQGTAAKELIEDAGALDLLLVPVGGGGLISGCAIAAQALSPGCRVIGVEPEVADDAGRSFRSGTLHSNPNPPTIADGANTASLGKLTFPLLQRYVSDMVAVSEAQLVAAMFLLWERAKLVVEPTGALGACALLEHKVAARGLRVGVILSGGNVDLQWAARQLQQRASQPGSN